MGSEGDMGWLYVGFGTTKGGPVVNINSGVILVVKSGNDLLF